MMARYFLIGQIRHYTVCYFWTVVETVKQTIWEKIIVKSIEFVVVFYIKLLISLVSSCVLCGILYSNQPLQGDSRPFPFVMATSTPAPPVRVYFAIMTRCRLSLTNCNASTVEMYSWERQVRILFWPYLVDTDLPCDSVPKVTTLALSPLLSSRVRRPCQPWNQKLLYWLVDRVCWHSGSWRQAINISRFSSWMFEGCTCLDGVSSCVC